MKLPRDVGADQLIKALKNFGYSVDHIKGSHIRITTQQNAKITKRYQITILSKSERSQRYLTISLSTTI
jgi:predicted RNA binding protein YcfA (HicA-like mRNA interferase family)